MKLKLTILIALATILTGFNGYSANCKPDSLINYNYVPGTLVKEKTTRVIYEYNSAGNVIKENLSIWNDSSNAWIKWRTNTFTLNANGQRTQEIQQYWDGLNWIDQFRNTYQYNGTGSVSQQLQQIYNNGTWNNNYKVDVAFNAANDTLQEVRQNWNTGTWENDYRIDYTYNLDTLVQRSLMSWSSNTWFNVWKEEYVYNTLNLLDKSTYYKIVNGSYAFAWSHTYVYNGSKQLLQTNRHEWDFTESNWKPDYQYDYIYNNEGCLVTSITSRNQLPGSTGPFDRYYQSDYFISGVAGITNENALTINCYPVPAANQLTINTEEALRAKDFWVVNIMGQTMAVDFLNDTPTSKTLNVQQYPKGVYLLHAKGSTIRFVKE